MFEPAARLQTHSQEMVKCINEMWTHQQRLTETVTHQEHELAVLEQETRKLKESLVQNRRRLEEQGAKLYERESGYNKLVEELHELPMAAKKDEKEFGSDPPSRQTEGRITRAQYAKCRFGTTDGA